MKNLKLLFFFLFVQLSIVFAQEQKKGIEFKDITYQEALELSKKTGKPIFIDAYTSWCGPCKYMSARVFTDEKLAQFFNTHFINLKIEMEKSTDGSDVARRFRVNAYPTLLFIDGNERLMSRQVGAVDAVVLLDQGNSVVKSQK